MYFNVHTAPPVEKFTVQGSKVPRSYGSAGSRFLRFQPYEPPEA